MWNIENSVGCCCSDGSSDWFCCSSSTGAFGRCRVVRCFYVFIYIYMCVYVCMHVCVYVYYSVSECGTCVHALARGVGVRGDGGGVFA